MIHWEYSVMVFCFVVPIFIIPKEVKAEVADCYGLQCPEGTVACEKRSDVSEDHQQIVHNIRCLDDNDKVLLNDTKKEENSYGPNFNFHGYSYRKVMSYNVYFNNAVLPDVVDVSENAIAPSEKESPTDTAGELDDLNSSGHSFKD